MSRNSQLESKIPQTHEESKGESAVDSRSPQKSQWAKALGGNTPGLCAELQDRHCETRAEGEDRGRKWS